MCDYMIMCMYMCACTHLSFLHALCLILSLPGQDVLQRLHQSHLVLSRQRGLEEDLWTPQTLRPHKQLVVLRHVEHRLERVTS